jgi:hypothetical protein
LATAPRTNPQVHEIIAGPARGIVATRNRAIGHRALIGCVRRNLDHGRVVGCGTESIMLCLRVGEEMMWADMGLPARRNRLFDRGSDDVSANPAGAL